MRSDARDYARTIVALETLSHPEHRTLLDYWQRARAGAEVPLRSSFDPADVPQLLPRVALIEAAERDGGLAFRYRLAGTEISARAGRDPTGKWFEDLYEGNYLERANQTYLGLIESRTPHFSQRVYPISEGCGSLRYDRLILPYSSDGSAVDRFVLLIVVVEQDGAPSLRGSFKSYC